MRSKVSSRNNIFPYHPIIIATSNTTPTPNPSSISPSSGQKVSSYFFFYAIAASLQPDPARINSINDYNTQTLTRSQVQRQKNHLACSEPCRFSSVPLVPHHYTNQAVLCLTPFIPQRPILSNSYAYQSPPSPIPLL